MTRVNGNGLMAERPSGHAHWLVRNTAVQMAHELYDHMMLDDEWYRQWKEQNKNLKGRSKDALETRFVEKNLSQLLPQARAMLAGMLRTTTDERQRDEIYNALVLDATLVRGRG